MKTRTLNTTRAPLCSLCGELIGVYEPMVEIEDGSVRITSIAADPGAGGAGHLHFHVDCYGRDCPARPLEDRTAA